MSPETSRNYSRSVLFGLLQSLLFATSAFAEDRQGDIRFPKSSWDPVLLKTLDDGPEFLPPDEPSLKAPPPPENASDVTVAELDRLSMLAASSRTTESVRLIRYENMGDISPVHLMFVREALPAPVPGSALYDYLEAVSREAEWFVLREKDRYDRARPSQLRASLSPVIPIPGHAAYPSVHATQMYAVTRAMAFLVPECSDEYRSEAFRVATRREIAGVHYASDTQAGQRLAYDLVGLMNETPEIRKLVAPSRSDLAGFLKENGCGVRAWQEIR